MNQQVPKEVMEKIREKARSFHSGLLYYESMGFLDGGIFGYSIAAEELARCREALEKIIKAKDAAMSTQDLFHVLQEIDKARKALSSLPGKQDGEIGEEGWTRKDWIEFICWYSGMKEKSVEGGLRQFKIRET